MALGSQDEDKGQKTVDKEFSLNFDMKLVNAVYPNRRKKEASEVNYKGTVTFRGKIFKDATMKVTEDEIKLSDELNRAVDDSDWDQFVKMALHYSARLCKENGIR